MLNGSRWLRARTISALGAAASTAIRQGMHGTGGGHGDGRNFVESRKSLS
jgi:hypothetical protein